jgi:hypothetical protein
VGLPLPGVGQLKQQCRPRDWRGDEAEAPPPPVELSQTLGSGSKEALAKVGASGLRWSDAEMPGDAVGDSAPGAVAALVIFRPGPGSHPRANRELRGLRGARFPLRRDSACSARIGTELRSRFGVGVGPGSWNPPQR